MDYLSEASDRPMVFFFFVISAFIDVFGRSEMHAYYSGSPGCKDFIILGQATIIIVLIWHLLNCLQQTDVTCSKGVKV